jgi:predicted nucleic acid-binding protein
MSVRKQVDHLVLDCEGLQQAARTGDVQSRILEARHSGRSVRVSAITLAEALRGRPGDAAVHRVLKQCEVVPVSAELGHAAGALLGRTRRKDTVDAVVAVTAAAGPRPVKVLTSDPRDLRALTAEQREVLVERV